MYFRSHKWLFGFLSLAVCASILYSIWWLRPLLMDGGRYSFQLIHTSSLYFDNRFSHGLFQIPTLILLRDEFQLSPLSLARIYHYTLTIPIIFTLIFRIINSRNMKDLFYPASVLFVGLIPGISYTVSSVFETAFFYYLMQDYLKSGKKWQTIVTGILVSLGHPAFIIGSIITLVMYFRDKRYWIFFGAMIFIQSVLIVETWIDFNGMPGFWAKIATDYLRHIHTSDRNHASMCVVFIALVFSNHFGGKKRVYLQTLLSLLIAFLAITQPGADSIQGYAYFFRVFTVAIVIALMISRWIDLEISQLTVSSLLFMALYFTYMDFRIAASFRNVFSYISDLPAQAGCTVVSPPEQVSRYTMTNLTVYKLFADNRWDVSGLYSDSLRAGTPCALLGGHHKIPEQGKFRLDQVFEKIPGIDR